MVHVMWTKVLVRFYLLKKKLLKVLVYNFSVVLSRSVLSLFNLNNVHLQASETIPIVSGNYHVIGEILIKYTCILK